MLSSKFTILITILTSVSRAHLFQKILSLFSSTAGAMSTKRESKSSHRKRHSAKHSHIHSSHHQHDTNTHHKRRHSKNYSDLHRRSAPKRPHLKISLGAAPIDSLIQNTKRAQSKPALNTMDLTATTNNKHNNNNNNNGAYTYSFTHDYSGYKKRESAPIILPTSTTPSVVTNSGTKSDRFCFCTLNLCHMFLIDTRCTNGKYQRGECRTKYTLLHKCKCVTNKVDD